jgi:hypothetical protein
VASKRFPLRDEWLAQFRFAQTDARNGTGGAETPEVVICGAEAGSAET